LRGAYLPGDRSVELRDVDDPRPGYGQLLLRMRASTICGSDIRAIYREHLGRGPEAYRDVIAGHEPSGEVIEVGDGCRRFRVGDRVVVYHIAGCGLCEECRTGYMIGCTSPERAAYGWQRDGGHADYLLAEERTCLALPEPLTFVDGANVACGFGTAYEAVVRGGVSGRTRVLITGLGPIGLGAGLLARAMGASSVIGVDVEPERAALAERIGAVDRSFPAAADSDAAIRDATGGGCEVAIDCSGSAAGRALAIGGTARWGTCVLIGEGGRLELDASPSLIHPRRTVIGSWVTSIWRMEELLDRLVRWDLHPETTVTDRFGLDEIGRAYEVADSGRSGKVAVVMEP
jgi:threonine dehydrogenase-like Zn-dependent dehydrogenase